MVGKKKFFVGIFLFLLVLPFIFSAPNPPTNLFFEGNSNANYDEGHFSVNWSSGGGDVENWYRVYIFSNEVFLMTAPNTSNTGYEVSGPAEARYTFIVEALNGAGERANSSGNISISVDSTPPTLDVVGYVKGAPMKNTQNLELNLFIDDLDSGVTGSVCLVNVDGAMTNMSASGGWCNSTGVSLEGASDGNKTIYISVKDLAGNLAFNNSYRVWIDTSGPVIDFICSPSSVYLNEEVICNCNATDSGAGVNYTEFSSNPSTSELGTFTRTCTAYDLLGNSNSKDDDYTVLSGAPYTGDSPLDSSTDSQISWVYTYEITESEFREGYTQNLAIKRRIKAPLGLENHSVGVLGINESHVTLEIASTPVQKILGIGESVSLDVSGDDVYDIYIFLNSISGNNSANLTVQGINQENSLGLSGDKNKTSLNVSGNQTILDDEKENLKGKLNKIKIYIIIGSCLFIIISFVIIYLIVRKKSFREMESNKNLGTIQEDSPSLEVPLNTDSPAESNTELTSESTGDEKSQSI